MNENTVTIDLRPLAPPERHSLIFSTWANLPVGHTMRIVNDHNPMPLKYLFQGEYPGQFDWQYEKSGPTDWIVRVQRTAPAPGGPMHRDPEEEKAAFKDLIRRLHAGAETAAIKEEAKDVLRGMDARKLAMLEQEIIQEGVGRAEMRRLCDAHLEIMRENLDEGLIEPETGHPIHTLMEEHKVIKAQLAELGEFLAHLKAQGNGAHPDLQIPREIAHHLLEAEKHHEREEQVIFPHLEKHGVTEPPQIMREEHEELRARKEKLHQVSSSPDRYAPQEVLKYLQEAGDYLVKEMTNHIYKEDNVLYQIALQTIEKDEWAEMKKRCDEIGYCCFTPAN
ncbi:MAG: sensory box protein [Dehalococcoidia bacterium]|nr:sensory box protein [Dehalococcoidia bacterium]